MALSDIELKRIEKVVGEFCRRRSPDEFKDKLSIGYKMAGHEVLIYERRPKWDDPQNFIELPVAKLRYTRTTNVWHLYWQRANMRWVAYEPYAQDRDIGALVRVIDRDEYGCFFG